MQDINNISYLSISFLLVFVLIIIGLNYHLQLKVNKRTILAIIRMVIQLSLVGIFLQYLFKLNNSLINLMYVLMMIFIASSSTIKACNFSMKRFILPLFFALLIPNIILITYFNFFVAKLKYIFDAQYMIPVAGMLLGNTLNGCIVGLNRFYTSIKDNEKQYFYSLSMSANRIETLTPYYKNAIQTAINPTIASIETIGLVALPGMMTGQILGGSIPITAIKYQIAIMIAILVSKYFSVLLSLLFTVHSSFDDFDILKDLN